jgi:probable O-glycosylation ligase (exosortase A-associated)
VLSFLAILGSYSRGAFVALVALGMVWWLRSRNKLLYLIFAAFLALPAFEFMPQSYYDRLSTIDDASSDGSFQGRVTAWNVAFDYARDHFPIGAGLDGPQNPQVYNHYFPTQPYRAAHSIYFQVLGDNGFAGLAIYLVLLALVFVNCSRARRAARDRPEFSWARDLATAIQLSMVAFCVGGAALSLAYSDFLFIWAALLSRILALLGQRQTEAVRHGSFATQGYPVPAIAIPAGANRDIAPGDVVHA